VASPEEQAVRISEQAPAAASEKREPADVEPAEARAKGERSSAKADESSGAAISDESVGEDASVGAEHEAAGGDAQAPETPVAAVDGAEDAPSEPVVPWPAVDLPSPPPPLPSGPLPDVEALMAEAHALLDAGDTPAARNVMLTAVAVHRVAGRPDAALDVCLQLLAVAPGDPYVHLAIAGLQLDHGWVKLATEKIDLLLRLTALTGDTQAEADVHALAAERLRDEPQPSAAAR
jgi:hypothetical protein